MEKILKRRPVPVVPLALRGLWGSYFSHMNGPALSRPPRRFHSRIELAVGRIIPPHGLTAERLRWVVLGLRGALP